MTAKPATTDDLAALEKRLTDDVTALEQRLEEKIAASARETQRHFEVVAESLLHDFSGAFEDKLAQHEDRLVALERHSGLRR